MQAPATASTLDDASEPELRRVSVLFADIAGSTALIQHLDPEAAAGLIDPALQAMTEAVERHGGIVNSRGDGVMAIFGAPSAAEDHGLRACLAALDIRDALRANDGVPVRIGIHAGDAVVRRVRSGRTWTQDAVGVTVHIAARLEQTAESGTICLSGAVWRLVRGFVQASAMQPIAVKGIDEPIERYLLLDAERTANRWGVRAANGLSEFVNRAREFAALKRALDAAEGLRVVQLVGAPGMGKSRLAHEFLRTPAARARTLVSLIGDLHRRNVPFHPVASWLREWLAIRATDSRAEARRKLDVGLAGLRLPATVTADLLARMLGIAAPGKDPADEMRRVDFGAAFAALVGAIAVAQRILLLCEDLDCLDAASRELFELGAASPGTRDVLVLTTSRSRVRLPYRAHRRHAHADAGAAWRR